MRSRLALGQGWHFQHPGYKEKFSPSKETKVAQTMAAKSMASRSPNRVAVAGRMERSLVDRLVSWTGVVVAVALLALGGAAIFGGSFALSNVKDRLVPEKISFPPASAMTPQEKVEIGTFAGQRVDTGPEAEAFSRYIGGHLKLINNGATYSETSSAARVEGIPAKQAADLSIKADLLFKGETLRSILLNAYGWWTVGQITLWAGIGAVIAGLLLSVFSALGFFHAARRGTN
jgi:hypothetical protein